MSKNNSPILLSIIISGIFILIGCQPGTPLPIQVSETAPVDITAASPEPVETSELKASEDASEGEQVQVASDDQYSTVDPSGQTITFWHQYSYSYEQSINEIIEEYNNSNPWGITVIAEQQKSPNEIYNLVLSSLNTPDAPNVVMAYQNQAATFHLVDALVDMTNLVNSPNWGISKAEKLDFYPGIYNHDIYPTYDNVRLGFPFSRSMEVLYYNKDWLEELGYNAPPQSFEEFKEMACKAAGQPFSKASAEGSIGYELDVEASTLAAWTFAHGGDVFQYDANQYDFGNDSTVAAMQFLQDLILRDCAAVVAEKYGDDEDFGAGKLLFETSSTAAIPYIKKAVDTGAKFNWNITSLPHTTPDPVQNTYGPSLSILKSNPEQEIAAWLFIKHLTEPEVQSKWAKDSNYFPVRKSAAEGLQEFFTENPAYQAAYELLPYNKVEPPVPGYGFVRELVAEAISAIINNADAKFTLSELNDEANTILNEQQSDILEVPIPTESVESGYGISLVGTEDHPIKVLFVPSTDVDFMIESGDLIEQALNEATGLVYETSVPTSYAATIEEMCASPEDTIGFIPAMGYALANQLCGVEPGLASERFGRNVYWAQFIVPRDSEAQTLEDLEGKSWGFGEVTSTSGYLYPLALLSDLGVTTGEQVETGGHPETVKAVYNGEVDFGTTYFSPPLLPEGGWQIGDPPDIPDDLVADCGPNEEGKLYCGGYRVMDARQTIIEEAPDVVQKVRILDITKEIPNDTLSFSPEFPDDLKQAIMDAIVAYVQTEACLETFCSTNFYGWTAAAPIFDENFDGIRILMEAQGITLENIGG